MLAKALAIFFIVVTASPVNAPFLTLDLGDLLGLGVSGRRPSDEVTFVAGNEDANASAQQNLPATVRPLGQSRISGVLMSAIGPESSSVESAGTVRHTLHGPAQPLRIAHTPARAVLRL
jgi:hypothetical protein